MNRLIKYIILIIFSITFSSSLFASQAFLRDWSDLDEGEANQGNRYYAERNVDIIPQAACGGFYGNMKLKA